MFTKKPENFCMEYIENSELEQVRSFKYLGTIINQDCIFKKEVCLRIEQARATIIKMKNLFIQREIRIGLGLRKLK